MGKLKPDDIRGVAYSWFECYLKDRKQYVSINGYDSKYLPISLGVSQGFVLGPLLFIIYINCYLHIYYYLHHYHLTLQGSSSCWSHESLTY